MWPLFYSHFLQEHQTSSYCHFILNIRQLWKLNKVYPNWSCCLNKLQKRKWQSSRRRSTKNKRGRRRKREELAKMKRMFVRYLNLTLPLNPFLPFFNCLKQCFNCSSVWIRREWWAIKWRKAEFLQLFG